MLGMSRTTREPGPCRPSGRWPVALAAAGLLTACATASQTPGPWESWKTLRLKARAMALFSGRVDMELRDEGGKRHLETRTVARFFGARIAQSRTSSILDASTGRTERYESISKKRGRRYVFGDRSYRVEKLKPTRGADRPLDDWEVQWQGEFAYPTTESGATVAVFDYYGMLLQLRRLDLHDDGDEATIHVATTKGPTAFRIVVAESREGEQSFVDPNNGGKRTLATRELRLRIIPADPEQGEEGFLDMEGETELWVEAESKTLLRLSGKIPKVPGRVHLVLAEMG